MAETRNVYFVTHGAVVGPSGDPALTEPDLYELRRLKAVLPSSPSHVICGTGRRFREISQALGLMVGRWTPVVGGPEYLEGRTEHDMVRLASGHRVPMTCFTGVEDNFEAASRLLVNAPSNAIIIGGRQAAEQVTGCPPGPVAIRYTVGEGSIQGVEIINP